MIRQCAILAVLVLVTPALAQTFEPRVAFRTDHAASTAPTVLAGGIVEPAESTIPLSVLFGPFNAQGFDNRGLFNFIGTVTISDPLGVATLTARRVGDPPVINALRAPYNFGNIVQEPDPSTVYFDVNRGVGEVILTYSHDDPFPVPTYTYPQFDSAQAGSGGAPDAFFPGLRLQVDLNSTTPRVLTLVVQGEMQAVNGWFIVGGFCEDPDLPCVVGFIPGGFVAATVFTTLTILPSPGAVGVLAFAGLIGSIRRRRG